MHSPGKPGIKLAPMNQTDLHFGRMDIDVDCPRLHGKMQHIKGKLMLHQTGFVSLLHGFGNDVIAHIAPVYKAGLEIAVGAVDFRFSQKALHRKSISLHLEGKHSIRHVPPVNPVDDLL